VFARSTTQPGYVRELDGLRGIAVILLLVHQFWPRVGPFTEYGKLPHFGWIGVDLWFVIGGFIVLRILLEARERRTYFRDYAARRLLRAWPLYFAVVLASFAFIPMLQGGPYGQTEFVQRSGSIAWYLFHAGNVREAITGVEPAYVLAILGVVSVAEHFYLLLFMMMAACRVSTVRWALVAMLLVAPLFRTAMLVAFPENVRIQYLATPSRVDVLALGALLALMLHAGPLPAKLHRSIGWVALTLLAMLVASAVAFDGLDRTSLFCRTIGYSVIGAFFGAVVLWAVANRETQATRALRAGWLCYLGKICFGIYLLQRIVHVILLKSVEAFTLPVDIGGLPFMVANIGVTLAVASLSWHLFERPLLRFKRVVGAPRSADAVPAKAI
jgi:peptidoglycan/LPS O-acetylase OafA/YrhL